MIIPPDVVAEIEREAGGPVYVSDFHWHLPGLQRPNEGYNMLCHGKDAHWSDEMPLASVAGGDVPAGANGHVVLSCDRGGFAVIDPDGQFLGLRVSMLDVLTLIEVLSVAGKSWSGYEGHCLARDRQIRLLGVACSRLFWSFLPDKRCRNAVEVAERYADGEATQHEKDEACQSAHRWYEESAPPSIYQNEHGPTPYWYAARAAENCINNNGSIITIDAQLRALGCPTDLEVALVRCIFGNPFRPGPNDLVWQTPTVLDLAQAAYAYRILPAGTLEPARFSVLSDALEEAGCDNADILNHLRGPGPHARGCWVVDLLLGKQ